MTVMAEPAALFELPESAYRRRRCRVCGGSIRQPFGDTYLMQRQGFVKIGKSKHPETRLQELRLITRQRYIRTPVGMDASEPLLLIAVMTFDREHELHERWAADHVGGEWFLPGREMRAWLKGLCPYPWTCGPMFCVGACGSDPVPTVGGPHAR